MKELINISILLFGIITAAIFVIGWTIGYYEGKIDKKKNIVN